MDMNWNISGVLKIIIGINSKILRIGKGIRLKNFFEEIFLFTKIFFNLVQNQNQTNPEQKLKNKFNLHEILCFFMSW